MKLIDRLALTILILAGLLIALAGLFDFNVIEMIFGTETNLGAQIPVELLE